MELHELVVPANSVALAEPIMGDIISRSHLNHRDNLKCQIPIFPHSLRDFHIRSYYYV